jgi:UDP-N-acetylglucosamine--N-acetylmuramyl-(pentapeptide) pyrophosphoryl-undecaprenol N-acetylglucosamine transferase
VPRRLAHGEHVDDHQIQIAGELGARGLALSVEADELTLEHLRRAAATGVNTLPTDPPFLTRGAESGTPLSTSVPERALR